MLHTFVVDKKPGPQWVLTIIVDDQTGDGYVPAVASGAPEGMVMMAAGYEGWSIITHKKHLFCRLEDLAKEYPEMADLWALGRQRIADARRMIEEGKRQPETTA